MENNQKPEPKNKQRPGSSLLVKLGLAMVALFLIIIFGLWLNGNLVITFKDPSQAVVIREEICGDDIINEYNDILNSQSVDTERLLDFSQSLNENYGNSDDPTCLFIIAQGLAYSAQADDAAQVYEKLKSLEQSNGQYASGRINSLSGLRDLSAIADPAEVELNEDGSW